MPTLTVYLPDAVYTSAAFHAKQQSLDVATLCSGLLADYFFSRRDAEAQPASKAMSTPLSAQDQSLRAVDVPNQFHGFPHRSVEFAQKFVDEVLKIRRVAAYKKGSEIAFDPNFVYIEALLSQGRRAGIRVSFFGRPEQFKDAPSVLRMGRPPSYSRAVIETASDLEAILPLIRQSYILRFGQPPSTNGTSHLLRA
jgi:hypothetical protein